MYYLFVTDHVENTFLYEYDSMEEVENKMDELDKEDYPYNYRVIHGEEV